jgi:hypothetical protein
MKTRRLALAAMLFLLVDAPYAELYDKAKLAEQLGTVHCDTSCSASARPEIR